VSTIDAIIEDATRWQRSVESVHGIFAFHVFALVLSSLVPGGSLIRDNGVTFFIIISLDWTETQMKHTVTVPCQVRSAVI